ncbi:MAG: TetR/AcrR family transcriptional regulator [Thermodesulfobacteria bacterium]|nr:TetR/AcrR family transcriptional regulator [Thermodesulfobacteriota bacterium]
MNKDSKISRPRKRGQKIRETHRREILEAALKVFSRKGYHRASMQEIAAEADFAVGTIYRFFPSKKALYEALVLEEISRFHQQMMLVFRHPPDDPLEALKAVISHRLQLVREHFSFIRMYLAELWEARFRGGFVKEIRDYYEEYLEALAGVLEGFGRRDISNRKLASIIDGILSTLIVEAIENESPLPQTEEIMEILLQPLVWEKR